MKTIKAWLPFYLILGALFCVIALTSVSPETIEAAGHIGLKNVTQPLRTRDVSYTLQTPDTGNNTTDVTVGLGGVVAAKYFPVGSNTITMTDTSTNVALPPYPCKLRIYVKDGDNDADALTCTGDITVCGYNQFGQPANLRNGTSCETLSDNISEGTEIATDRVYERVTSVTAAGCSGNVGADTNNLLVVGCSTAIGLPLPIDNFAGLVSICIQEDSDPLQCFGGNTAGGAGDAEDIDLDDEAVILEDAGDYTSTGIGEDDDGADITVDDGDIVWIRVRAPAGL